MPCPATAPFARDRLYGTRSGTGSFRPRLTLRHAIRHRLLSPATDCTAHDPAPAPCARDTPYRTRSGTGSLRTRHALPHAIRHRLLAHATGHTGRCDRRRTIRDAMILSCPTMPGRCPDDARTMPGNARKCPDDGRLFPVMFDEPVRPATALGVESGPTIRVRCAAGRHEDRYG